LFGFTSAVRVDGTLRPDKVAKTILDALNLN
jgi:hypothetical protein